MAEQGPMEGPQALLLGHQKSTFIYFDVLLQPSAGKLSMNQWAIPQAQVIHVNTC